MGKLYKLKKKIHNKIIDLVFNDPSITGINNIVKKEKHKKLGPYELDIVFIVKQKPYIYNFLVLEEKSRGYGKSYRESEIKMYKILDCFIKNKKSLIEKYSKEIGRIDNLFFDYRFVFPSISLYNKIEIQRPVSWKEEYKTKKI